jgi:hypothetical protein
VLPATWVVVEDAVAGALLRLSRDADGKELLPTPAELEYEQRVAAEVRVRELEAELLRREPLGERVSRASAPPRNKPARREQRVRGVLDPLGVAHGVGARFGFAHERALVEQHEAE